MAEIPMRSGSQLWDRNDLQRRLRHALEIADQAVQHLADSGYSDSLQPENNFPPDKLLAETAFLLLAAAAASPTAELELQIARLAQRLIPLARSNRVLFTLTLHPALALDYAHAHICLSRLGYPDPLFDKHLLRVLGSRVVFSRERVPYRMLELAWARQTWRSAVLCSGDSNDSRSLDTILNHSIDIFGASAEDIYALTHAVMYLRDFNLSPQPLPRPRWILLAEAEGLLARAIDQHDYDIAAELLMAWPLTGKKWSSGASFAFAVLAHIEDEAGYLPAASTRLNRIERLRGAKRKRYVLATAYHTAYVMGILCAVALQPGRLPPATIRNSSCISGSVERISPFLADDSHTRHWAAPFARLSSEEQNALSPFLLSIALHRATSRRDFCMVGSLLKLASSLGLSDSPTCSQAAELLDRLSRLVTLSGLGRQETKVTPGLCPCS